MCFLKAISHSFNEAPVCIKYDLSGTDLASEHRFFFFFNAKLLTLLIGVSVFFAILVLKIFGVLVLEKLCI